MPTEVEQNADIAVLVALGYLERNDFTDLVQVESRLITAKDGRRDVLVWVDVCASINDLSGFLCPQSVILRAAESRARVDIIKIGVAGTRAKLVHMMNVMS